MEKLYLGILLMFQLCYATPPPAPDIEKGENALKLAGVLETDILVSINGIKLVTPGNGVKAFQALNRSKRATIKILRGGVEKTIIYIPKGNKSGKH